MVVSTNMMGDIITDLASVLQGGMGFAAGGNIGTTMPCSSRSTGAPRSTPEGTR